MFISVIHVDNKYKGSQRVQQKQGWFTVKKMLPIVLKHDILKINYCTNTSLV